MSAGDLVLGRDQDPREYDDCQPHQVSKKRALAARLRGLSAAGHPVYVHSGLRLDELDAKDATEEEGARERAMSGRFDEPMPDADDPA